MFPPFVKLCSILVLHELMHSKLYKENGDPDERHGRRFKAELKRLKDAGRLREAALKSACCVC